jgi:hypothetical protein
MEVIVPNLRSHGRFAWTSWRLRWPALTEELIGHYAAVLRSQGGKGARKPAKVTT